MTQMLGPEVDTISVDFALVRDIVDKVNDLIDQDAKQRGRRLGRADERQFAMARTMDVIVREGAARARQGLDMWSEVQENAIRDAVLDSMFRPRQNPEMVAESRHRRSLHRGNTTRSCPAV